MVILSHTKPVFAPIAHTAFSTHYCEYSVCVLIKRVLVLVKSSEFESASEDKIPEEILGSASAP